MSNEARSALNGHIDAIETAYEFMLAYAAQGRDGRGADYVTQVKQFMNGMVDALAQIPAVAVECLRDSDGRVVESHKNFTEVLKEDAKKSSAIISFVLKQERVTSQLVDNTNASIHLRALLTDIFLLDEMLKSNSNQSS